jgi:16S rRNA (adenine1518-N6/adenine1519-N6)-dimethyltransferase
MPRPKVGSAVIRLTRHKTAPVVVDDEKVMFAIIRAAFNQRRKTLQNGLNNAAELSFTKEQIAAVLRKMDKPETVRGETFTLEDFATFTNYILQES